MNHSTETICKLCQSVLVGNDFGKIDENVRTTLTSVLNVNLDITKEDDLMCVDCATIMRNFVAFKSMCLNTENRIKIVLESVHGAKLNLKQVLPQEDLGLKEMTDDDQQICRFCMIVVNKGYFKLLSEMEPMFLNSIKQYIGDLDLTLTEDPVLCESCLNTMQKHFDFLNNLCAEKKQEFVKEMPGQKKGTSTILQDTSPLASVDHELDMIDVALLSNAVCNHTHTTNTLIPNPVVHNTVITQCPGFYDRPQHVNINAIYYDSGPGTDSCNCFDNCCEYHDCGWGDCDCANGNCGDGECGDGNWGDCDCASGNCGDGDCGDGNWGDGDCGDGDCGGGDCD